MTRLVTARPQRSSASTGARISTGKFSPQHPKGGFGANIYEALRYLDENYGSRTESYYKQRLLGNTPDDFRWRYDLNNHLLRREHEHKSKYVPSWLPRYPKKKFITGYRKKLQKGTKLRGSEFHGRGAYRDSDKWCRQHCAWSDNCYRCKSANWKYRKVRWSTVSSYKCCWSDGIHQL